jgi:hypothetical protein
VRRCRVSVRGVDGATHVVEVAGGSLFEAAASAVERFRAEGWVDALTPNAVLEVEVLLPPVTHRVPLKAIERWATSPSISPKDEITKRKVRSTDSGL